MNWLKRLFEPSRDTEAKQTKKEQARKEVLRIEELEARLAPTAIWGE
jgi:hypothetical protein